MCNTKIILLFLFIFLSKSSFSQAINYCNYFRLDVKEVEINQKKSKVFGPEVIENKKDNFSKFLKKHSNRFTYILWKKADNWRSIANYYPDTIKIKNEFCDSIIYSKQIQYYYYALTPKDLVEWNTKKDTFSIEEVLSAASKFFYAENVIKKDTSIQSRICIGVNGQKDNSSMRDLALVEAFAFEAIFHYLSKKKSPLFYKNFIDVSKTVAAESKLKFKDFNSYLVEVRSLCYERMKANKDLKQKLLEYYAENLNNLNFVIN